MKKLLVILLIVFSLPALATTYYVSNSGSDSNSGTSTSEAWATLSKVNGYAFAAGDQVLFKCGDIWYGTLLLHSRSGSSGSPITYGSYGTGAKPIITGFTTVTGWTNEGGGIYSKVITAESQTNMVTIDGVQYAMGRYPNTGYLTYESASTNVSITDNQLANSPSWVGAEAVIFKNNYDIDRCTVNSQSSGTIGYTSLGTTSAALTSDGRYFFQNSLQTLDQFGEWYHDTNSGKFYMYFGASSPTAYAVKVATLNYLVKATSGEDYVTIDGISLQGAAKHPIYLSWQNDYCNVVNCDVYFSGLHGVFITGTGSTVTGCTVFNSNSCGIFHMGTNTTIVGNTISYTGWIEGQGGISALYKAGLHTWYDNHSIIGNTISYTGWNGLCIGTNTLTATISNNLIQYTCRNASDQGSIYQSGIKTAISYSNNIILNSYANGIYLDEYSANVTVSANTVANCASGGIKLHKANHNTITGNKLFKNAYGLDIQNWLNEDNLSYNVITGNKITCAADRWCLRFITRYTNWTTSLATCTINNNNYSRPVDDDYSIKTNILVQGDLQKTLAEWKTLSGQDASSTKSPAPVSSESDIVFLYNATSSITYPQLPFACVDMSGTKKTGFVTLQPYTSFVGLKDPNPATPIVINKLPTVGNIFMKVGGVLMAIPQ